MRYVPFEEATPETYEGLGMISGLEIHQQLLTEKKLFCRCPAGRYSRRWDAEILRHMRPTLSELGEYDGTALMEFKTKKEITYHINKETVCTYEFDDTPPFMPNEQALDIALEVALLLNCSLVSEIHIARKQYLDGSIPTGFQRTTILGVDGWIPYKGRRIGIRQLAMEEDSCREVADSGHHRTYITDRLGMPLIESVTQPDMKTPQEVAEVGQILRRLVRATGKVRTGVGAGREDVNVSVRGGNRAEIKGVPSIRRIPLLVHNEAFRQAALLEIRDALRSRGVDPERFQTKDMDLTERLQGTRFIPIHHAIGQGKRVAGVLLRGFDGILRQPLVPGRSFLQEVSDRVRVIACIDLQPNLISSDSPDGTLSPDLWLTVRKALGAKSGDAVVLVWGDERDVATAVQEVATRCREAAVGVPLETRQAMPDGTTGFERILPGADRMYPDTDLPPKAVTDDRVARIRSRLPKPPWEREARYGSQGLRGDFALSMSVSPWAPLYDRLIAGGAEPVFAAWLLDQHFRSLRRRGFDPHKLQEGFLEELFSLHKKGALMRRGLLAALELHLKGIPGSPLELIERYDLKPAPEEELSRAVDQAMDQVRGRAFPDPADRARYAMGIVMERIGRRVDGGAMRGRVEAALKSAAEGIRHG
ncbi:MAG: Glu-tRNA(Gln) amidotransferase subunit GatE [Elusimicrobiota bacterium]